MTLEGGLLYSDRDDFIEGKDYCVLRDGYKNGLKEDPLWAVLAEGSGVMWPVCCFSLLRNQEQCPSPATADA